MKPSLQGITLWHHLKQTGLVLLLIAALTLLALLGVAATGMSHAQQGAVPTGGLMAPLTDPNDPTSSGTKPGLATTNGTIHIGEMAANNGEIVVG